MLSNMNMHVEKWVFLFFVEKLSLQLKLETRDMTANGSAFHYFNKCVQLLAKMMLSHRTRTTSQRL